MDRDGKGKQEGWSNPNYEVTEGDFIHFNSFLVASIVSAYLIFVNFGTPQHYLGL